MEESEPVDQRAGFPPTWEVGSMCKVGSRVVGVGVARLVSSASEVCRLLDQSEGYFSVPWGSSSARGPPPPLQDAQDRCTILGSGCRCIVRRGVNARFSPDST
jgi:hypothetical protein